MPKLIITESLNLLPFTEDRFQEHSLRGILLFCDLFVALGTKQNITGLGSDASVPFYGVRCYGFIQQ